MTIREALLLFFAAICLVLAWLLGQVLRGNSSSFLRVTFCDVGQGDATLVSLGYWQLLVDTGPDESVLACLKKQMPPFDSTLEWLVLTHPDKDHIGGVSAITQQLFIQTLAVIPVTKDTADFEALKQLALKGSCPVFMSIKQPCILPDTHFPYQGEWFQFSPDFFIKVLHPSQDFVYSQLSVATQAETQLWDVLMDSDQIKEDVNDLSIVLNISYYDFSLLIPGDISSKVESALITDHLITEVTMTKTPHHGSKHSTSTAYLTATAPELIVISAGKNNQYGHPSSEVLERVSNAAVPTWNTAERGALTIATDGERWWREKF